MVLFSIEGALVFFSLHNALRFLGLWLGYRLILCLYNISPFHPLYKFPGPRLAAASYLYEAWYDLILVGRYSWEIKAIHEKYGPVVRINPDELHCSDYDFVNEIYPSAGSRIRDKSPHFLAGFAGTLTVSSFGTHDHETHRVRRSAISRFFSRKEMLRYEPVIHEMALKMCDKFLKLARSGHVINAVSAYNGFAADTISQYCFGESFGCLDGPDFEKNYKRAFEVLVATNHIFRHIPILRNLIGLMPALGPYLGPDIAWLVKSMNETIPNHVIKAQNTSDDTRSIFADVLNSPIPDEHKTTYRLSGEGWSLVAAGSETTAASLSLITFLLLSHPEKLTRLRDELKNEDPEKLSWVRLEKYPYLHGVIFEGLRFGMGVAMRTPRIARNEDLIYKNHGLHYVIPRGTAIGMSAFVNHFNEEVFPDPETYEPQRWIDAQGMPDYGMEKYILSFSKGSRQCIGMHLAFCEIYLAIAIMALKVLPHLELYETTSEDIDYDFDAITVQPKKGARGVRVKGI